MKRTLLLSAATFTLGAAAHAQAPIVLHELHGAQAGEFLGWGSCLLEDIDGDGHADLVIGSPLADTSAGVDSGVVRVLSGADGSLIHEIPGPAPDNWFGQVTNDAGDVDGDGTTDFIVGAQRTDAPGMTDTGSVSVYSGATGTLLWRFYGDHDFDSAGNAVCGIGDVDLDGLADFAYGSHLGDSDAGVNTGMVWVRSGADGSLIQSFHGGPNDSLGVCADAGDVDQDGWPDVITGARWYDHEGKVDAGMARVWSGKDWQPLWTWYGDNAQDNLGNVVGGLLDLDADGHPDVGAGIWRADVNGDNSGAARAWSGATGQLLYQWNGDSPNDGFGVFIDKAGDVDGDDRNDVVIGVFQDDPTLNNAGSAYVFSGKDGGVIFHAVGQGSGDELGVIVHGGKDVDRNGFADVIAGAYWNDLLATNGGASYVYSACGGTALEYAEGCDGTGGFRPRLGFLGCPGAGATIEMRIDHALGGSSAIVFLGLGQQSVQLQGACTLDVLPLLPAQFVLPLTGGGAGDGAISVPLVVPGTLPSFEITLQAVVIDPGVFHGYAVSNAVVLGTP